MIDQLFNLFSHNPLISTVGILLLAGLFMWIFREEIKLFIKKRFDLYDRTEVHSAVVKAQEVDRNMNIEADTETMAILVVDHLEHKPRSK